MKTTPMIDEMLEKTKAVRGSDPPQPNARKLEQPAQTDGQEQSYARQWTSSIPQVASEDIIEIGNVRYAHFRRDRRFAQVQVVFTAPGGVDPNPGRELTDQFKELGWRWRSEEPGKPWRYQLDKSSPGDPTARGDRRGALPSPSSGEGHGSGEPARPYQWAFAVPMGIELASKSPSHHL